MNDSITQWVEIRPEKERFHRLLEILGEWYDKGKLLIFVDKQESCDNLFRCVRGGNTWRGVARVWGISGAGRQRAHSTVEGVGQRREGGRARMLARVRAAHARLSCFGATSAPSACPALQSYRHCE